MLEPPGGLTCFEYWRGCPSCLLSRRLRRWHGGPARGRCPSRCSAGCHGWCGRIRSPRSTPLVPGSSPYRSMAAGQCRHDTAPRPQDQPSRPRPGESRSCPFRAFESPHAKSPGNGCARRHGPPRSSRCLTPARCWRQQRRRQPGTPPPSICRGSPGSGPRAPSTTSPDRMADSVARRRLPWACWSLSSPWKPPLVPLAADAGRHDSREDNGTCRGCHGEHLV